MFSGRSRTARQNEQECQDSGKASNVNFLQVVLMIISKVYISAKIYILSIWGLLGRVFEDILNTKTAEIRFNIS